MSWFYLIVAGLFEIGWPLGFKLASTYTKYNILFFGVSVISMALSGVFLYLAQKTIPIGTAYVIWTGVGAVGTLLIGILFFGDSADVWRLFFTTLIIIGISYYNRNIVVSTISFHLDNEWPCPRLLSLNLRLGRHWLSQTLVGVLGHKPSTL